MKEIWDGRSAGTFLDHGVTVRFYTKIRGRIAEGVFGSSLFGLALSDLISSGE